MNKVHRQIMQNKRKVNRIITLYPTEWIRFLFHQWNKISSKLCKLVRQVFNYLFGMHGEIGNPEMLLFIPSVT